MSFVHLHCHSEYSLLDGANRIGDLISRAQELEQPALAVTDHGNLHGAWDFQEKAKKAGIKPIIGMEAYVSPGDRRERSRPRNGGKPYYHLVLLARDAVGYRNLVKLSSLAYTEGFYTKPRVDRELLAKYSEGLIVSSACIAGEIATHLLEGRLEEAKGVASWYANTFPDRYYLEVQAHDSGGLQSKLNALVLDLSAETGIPVIATNDAHFLRDTDHDAHDVLLCIGLGKDRSDHDRMRYDNGLYFKSAPEIAARFPGRPDVLENTLKIADEVSVSFSKKYHVPSFPLPTGVGSENELLVRLSEEGAKMRYGDPLPSQRARAPRLRAERHHEDRLRRLLPDHLRLHQGRARPGHSRRPRPRIGRRLARRLLAAHHRCLPAQVRSPLRALPESGARLDARHRRRLLLRAARRGHRVRAPEVRPRFRRPDHHLRNPEVARRHQGRRPRARLHPRRNRRAREAHPEPAELLAHGEGSDLADRRGEAALPERPALQAAARLRDQARGSLAPRRSSRRRHRHRAGPARRIRPRLHAELEGRRRLARRRGDRRHAVRHERAREGGDAQDGFPRPHDAHDHPRCARAHRGDVGHAAESRRAPAG